MTDLIGQSLGRYHVLEQLGEGGMATVYKAYDTRLERDVAIKIIRTDLFGPAVMERILKRFEREAKSLAKLSHPNIVGVMDFGDYQDAPYLVLEYLPGGTLKGYLGQKMAWQAAVHLLLPIAQALGYAHSHGVIHRDVKPANILLTENGQPMLTDFGIAKILDTEEGHTLTGTGVGIGTPEYMAPEQGMGKQIDERADIYALGITLYELITGRKPYIADTPMAVVFKHMTDPLPSCRQFVPDLPEPVEKVVLKALAKDPQDRYPSAEALIAALDNLLMKDPGARPVSMPAQSPISGPQKLNPQAGLVQAADSDQGTRDSLETVAEPPPVPKSQGSLQVSSDQEPKSAQSKIAGGPATQDARPRWWIWGLVGVVGISLLLAWKFSSRPENMVPDISPATTSTPLIDPVSVVTDPSQPSAVMPAFESSGLLAEIQSRGFILVATDPNYEPQSFLNTAGIRPANTKCPADALSAEEMQGFDVDVARAIGDSLGVETCFATPGWDSITAGGWGDKWDIGVGSMIITTERLKVLDFSKPYYYVPAMIAVAQNSGVTSLAELEGKALCVGASTTYAAWVDGDPVALGLPASSVFVQPHGVEPVTLETDQECAQAIAAGRQDFVGYVTSESVIDANISSGFPVTKLEPAVFAEELAPAFDKSSSFDTASLRQAVDAIVTRMREDGTLSRLSIQWFAADLTREPVH